MHQRHGVGSSIAVLRVIYLCYILCMA